MNSDKPFSIENIKLEVWDIEDGKGIDDVEAAGKPTRLIEGTAALDDARQIKDEAFQADPPPVLKKIQELINKVKTDDIPDAVFDSIDFIASLAPAEQGKLKAALKQILGNKLNMNDLTKAINQASKKGTNSKLQLIQGGNNKKPVKKIRIQPLFEDGHGYYKFVARGNDVEEEILSNFQLIIHKRLTMPNGEEVLSADLIIDGGQTIHLDLPFRAFLSVRDLLLHLKTSEPVWLGKDNDLQLLRNHLLQQNAKKIKGVETLGRYEEFIVLPKIVINKNGPVEDPPVGLVDLYSTSLFKNVPYKYPSNESHIEASKSIFSHLKKINEPSVAGAVIGWTFSLPWCELIKTTPGWGGFPHLCLWGQAGSGKTELGILILRIYGVARDFEVFKLPGTRFTRIKNYATTNLIPLLLDEYRTFAWLKLEVSKFHEELRGVYSHLRDERGRANLETKTYPLVSPIILCGEDRPRDTTALEERMICVNLNKDIVLGHSSIYGMECSKEFALLQKAPLEDFLLPFLVWSLNYDDWQQDLEKARTAVMNWRDKTGFMVPARILNNLSILLFGWNVFETYANHLNIKTSDFLNGGHIRDAFDAAYFQVVPGGKQVNELDDLIMFISVMVSNGELENETHFTMKGGNVLIRLNAILPIAYEYARRTDRRRELLGEDAYRSLIANMAGKEDSYVISTTERGQFNSPNGGKTTFRGVLINPDILEKQTGIEANIWKQGTQMSQWSH